MACSGAGGLGASQDEDKTHDRVQEPWSAVEVSFASVRTAGLFLVGGPQRFGTGEPTTLCMLVRNPAAAQYYNRTLLPGLL